MRTFQVEVDITHQPLLVSEKQNNYPFICYQNIGSMFFFISSQNKRMMDRQPDRRTYDRITITTTAVA